MKTKPSRIYVGVKTGKPNEIFRYHKTPTVASHGKRFGAVMGPFTTMRGAEFYQKYGGNNPHIQHVADAERLAKLHANDLATNPMGDKAKIFKDRQGGKWVYTWYSEDEGRNIRLTEAGAKRLEAQGDYEIVTVDGYKPNPASIKRAAGKGLARRIPAGYVDVESISYRYTRQGIPILDYHHKELMTEADAINVILNKSYASGGVYVTWPNDWFEGFDFNHTPMRHSPHLGFGTVTRANGETVQVSLSRLPGLVSTYYRCAVLTPDELATYSQVYPGFHEGGFETVAGERAAIYDRDEPELGTNPRRPFHAGSTELTRARMTADANKKSFGRDYGIFFDTSGRLRIEPVNPTAQYNYLYTTLPENKTNPPLGEQGRELLDWAKRNARDVQQAIALLEKERRQSGATPEYLLGINQAIEHLRLGVVPVKPLSPRARKNYQRDLQRFATAVRQVPAGPERAKYEMGVRNLTSALRVNPNTATGYQMTAPMLITSRLLPGVRIGNVEISLKFEGIQQYGNDWQAVRPRYRWFIDGPDLSATDNDLRGDAGRTQPPIERVMASLLSFLSGAVESRNSRERRGKSEINPDGNEGLFPPDVVEWASQHDNEITMTMMELDPENYQ